MSDNVFKAFGTVAVQVRDGKPLCPHCQEPMVETDPNLWKCPDAARWDDVLAAALARALKKASA